MHKFKSKIEFVFEVNDLKQSRPWYVSGKAKIERFEQNWNLSSSSLTRIFEMYREQTNTETKLFISFCKQYQRVTKAMISRWIKTGMSWTGIDITEYKAHSVRVAATSKAYAANVPIDYILSRQDGQIPECLTNSIEKPSVIKRKMVSTQQF